METSNQDIKYFAKEKISHWNGNANIIVTSLDRPKTKTYKFCHIKQIQDSLKGPQYTIFYGFFDLATNEKMANRIEAKIEQIEGKIGPVEKHIRTKEEIFAKFTRQSMDLLELVESAEDLDDYAPNEPIIYHQQSEYEKRCLFDLINQMKKGDELTFNLRTDPTNEEITMYYVCLDNQKLKHFHLDKDHMARSWNQYEIPCSDLHNTNTEYLYPTGNAKYMKQIKNMYKIAQIEDFKIRPNRFTEEEIENLIHNRPVDYDIICERNPIIDPSAYIQYIIQKHKTNELVTTLEKAAQKFIWYGKWGREAARACRGLARQAAKQKKNSNNTFRVIQGIIQVYKLYPRKTIKNILLIIDDVIQVEFSKETTFLI